MWEIFPRTCSHLAANCVFPYVIHQFSAVWQGLKVGNKMVQFTLEEQFFMVECYILTGSPNGS